MACYGDSGRLHQTLGEPGSGLRLSPLLPEDDVETPSQVWRAGISEPGGAEGSNPTKRFVLYIFKSWRVNSMQKFWDTFF